MTAGPAALPDESRRRFGALRSRWPVLHRPPAEGDRSSADPEVAIHSRGLAKRRGDRWTVDHLDLHIPTGALSGFVGPNGAGKSTTLRMLLGLIRPTEGSATVLGHPADAPERYLHRVGAMIEGPTFHPGLSGRGNLAQLAALRRLPARRVDEVLGQVGMASRADAPFATFSLGMKQRLGIAAALLPTPDLLILDEPTNGLDPAGIREIRTLLKDLAAGGMTVFVSSHLLSEVEQICDHLVMIRSGRLLFQGHVTELLAAGGPRIVLCPEHRRDAARLAALLRDAGVHADVASPGEPGDPPGGSVTAHAPPEDAADLNRLAAQAGITLRGLRTYRPSLEETFLEATGGMDGDLAPHRGAPADMVAVDDAAAPAARGVPDCGVPPGVPRRREPSDTPAGVAGGEPAGSGRLDGAPRLDGSGRLDGAGVIRPRSER